MLRLNDFTNYSVDGVLDRRALQSAISNWNREGMGDNANLVAMRGEMVTMLSVFGHAKGSISRSYVNEISDVISIDDIERLWLRSEWPEGWLEHRRQYEWAPISNIDLMMGCSKP
jgi:hypothetical protein